VAHDEAYCDDPEPLTAAWAWAIGLFEGEGCITIAHARSASGRVYPQARLHLCSTDEDVVRRFHRTVEVGTVRVAHDMERRGYKRQWRWMIGARADVRYLLSMFLPHLGCRRELRAIEALTLVEAQLA